MKIGHTRPRDEPVWSLTDGLAQALPQVLIVYSQCGTGVVSDQTISLDQDVAWVLKGGYIRLSHSFYLTPVVYATGMAPSNPITHGNC